MKCFSHGEWGTGLKSLRRVGWYKASKHFCWKKIKLWRTTLLRIDFLMKRAFSLQEICHFWLKPLHLGLIELRIDSQIVFVPMSGAFFISVQSWVPLIKQLLQQAGWSQAAHGWSCRVCGGCNDAGKPLVLGRSTPFSDSWMHVEENTFQSHLLVTFLFKRRFTLSNFATSQ